MQRNVGKFDRSLRIAAGLILIGPSLSGVIGLLPLASEIFRFCPAYPLLGVNTCKSKS
ncbi:DUF2892 domain-containing protein [Pseudomonas sp. NPDC077186]|uniref:DUF2892 domain-containing protein n=1 Tax=Pseudomonas sp. NPDC077186 TaxID=3364421 RepID=UPI0037C7CA81